MNIFSLLEFFEIRELKKEYEKLEKECKETNTDINRYNMFRELQTGYQVDNLKDKIERAEHALRRAKANKIYEAQEEQQRKEDEKKKYELVKDDFVVVDGKKLYRIRALRDFSDFKAGELGGYVESVHNLSQGGNCWVLVGAKVYGDERVLWGEWRGKNCSVHGH